ncbi:MAG: transcriptional regulator [Sulfurimonas sp. CG08_land_8_20_14_0_20_36_33]|nr:MAG: transcriptional regulator [Sulfurimonas sp. CG23_combo_of_CG06-09_8_20_14_all_36_33]PIS23880.1 MAG: transcriptional regulator [Sulfurimonas sp. CG08_land_8_20_14_0_20_36_33]PIU35250.1 MAG: transcriptional regulator [Sulfurimonas sp. CG07_land_8_20_14_0_80_36_56]PIV03913.1 MAG: transcriptional regulator [Sulfurimonas sp. CG03_land_8_20_14_0_80_36_25]PIV34239.1 MAG: transcriptional regulator [Sulfurimonas sp. CG02_land_8_20_14_3_00_36_67]PIV60099.1 MAG: transcriptional regulator [Sulfuri
MTKKGKIYMMNRKQSDGCIKVAIVNYEHALASAIIGIVDILAIVNNFCLDKSSSRKFDVKILHTHLSTKNFNMSIDFPSEPLNDQESFDLIIVPPLIDLEHKFNTSQQLLNWLQLMHNKGNCISSVCVGAYILAQAGLLNGKKATCHWVIEQKLKQDYPKIKLEIDQIVIDDDNVITAGGVTAYIDLCLYIVRKFISIEIAYVCANYLGVDAGRSSQQHYKNLSNIATHNDKDIELLNVWLKKNFSKSISSSDMAKRMHTSERTFIRKFKKATGELPNKYIQKLRVQKAKHLLITTNDSFEYITYLVGYTNTSTFRKLFKEMTGLNPGVYREYFMVK